MVMSERSIEATAETVEDAIAKGLAELEARPADVIVEVLEEPSKGVFGIGAHPAKVRLKLFRAAAPPPPPSPPEPKPKTQKPRPEKPVPAASTANLEEALADEEQDAVIMLDDEIRDVEEEDLDQDAIVSRRILLELLDHMQIEKAEIIVRRAGPADDQDGSPWVLDISGPDLKPLIGRKGETLASLQYVTRLIASRQLEHRANIVVDAAGYKARRAKMLKDLAVRMADQAIRSKRTVVLEPMPPYERRIVHLTLRNRADVQTKSVGEGTGRKVTIVPKAQ
jgi:spoIIIJ-associated protein